MANNPKAADNLKPAKKGEVRNPKGRPKGSKSAKTRAIEMLRALSSDKEPMTPIFAAIIKVMSDEECKPSDILKAADMLMDRIEGKAVAKIEDVTDKKPTPIAVDVPIVDGSKS